MSGGNGGEVDAVLAWVNSDDPKSVEALRRASDLLGRHARSGRVGVPEARMRIAVILERMGA